MYRVLLVLLLVKTQMAVPLGFIRNATWTFDLLQIDSQYTNESNTTCEQCLCQMMEMNNTAISAVCQQSQMTCQLLFSNVTAQLRLDTRSVVYFFTIPTFAKVTTISSQSPSLSTVILTSSSNIPSSTKGTTTQGSSVTPVKNKTLSWNQNATTVAVAPTYTLSGNRGINIVDNDTLYIADTGNSRIVVIKLGINLTGTIIGSGAGSSTNQLQAPGDVFVNTNFVLVMDTTNYRVQKWFKNGTNPVTTAGITGQLASQYDTVKLGISYNIYLDKDDYLYVSDFSLSRVLRYPPNSPNGTNGTVVAGTQACGSASNQLCSPLGIFVDNNKTLYITDHHNSRIQKWILGASNGTTVAGSGVLGTGLAQLYFPTDVSIDTNSNIYIVDSGNNRIVLWALNATIGVCIAGCTGVAGSGSNQLNGPISLAFDSNNSLYVSDTSNSRIQKFQNS